MVILLTIRQEIKTDYREVENLVRESFWNIYRPGCYEHYIIHNMRYAKSFIKQLDYLIEEDNHILYMLMEKFILTMNLKHYQY